jgi:cellulose synthase (UDP-forming)
MTTINEEKILEMGKVDRNLLLLNIVVAFFYFAWWLIPSNADNKYLYSLLLFGEIYHLFMAISFWHTVAPKKQNDLFNDEPDESFSPTVDVFITVAGEPVEIVKQTVEAVLAMTYPNFKVYVLNDGLVAKKDNWREIEMLAYELNVNCITRTIPGGAKAGNVNNALRQTYGQIITIFDADMVPKKNFLSKLIPFFKSENTGFVQSPQYYKNWSNNLISYGAWSQQEFFFGTIMKGKEKYNASFICGTNFAIRRKALVQVGGFEENNIAEDFSTSLSVHSNGWKSYYVNEILSEGLAPEDMLSYYKQQSRWARGSLQILFTKDNPIFKKGLNIHQRIEYLSSALYYFNGLIVLIDIIMPLIFLFIGLKPVFASSTSFALFFVPFIFLNLYTLRLSSGNKINYQALSFSQSSWMLQLLALKSIFLKQKTKFEVTSKRALSGNFLNLAYPHISYIALGFIGSVNAIFREGFSPSVLTNIAWVMVNSFLFLPFIIAAYKPGGLLNKEVNRRIEIATR